MPEFNIARFEACDTASFNLLDQKENEIIIDGAPVVVTMYSPGSDQGVKAQAAVDAGQQARLFAGMRGKTVKPDEQKNEQHKKLAAVTASISPNFPVAAKDIFSNPKLGYMTVQFQRFQDDWANFPSSSLQS